MSQRDKVKQSNNDSAQQKDQYRFLKNNVFLYERMAEDAIGVSVEYERQARTLAQQTEELKAQQETVQKGTDEYKAISEQLDKVKEKSSEIKAIQSAINGVLKTRGLKEAATQQAEFDAEQERLTIQLKKEQSKLRSVSQELRKLRSDPNASKEDIKKKSDEQFMTKWNVNKIRTQQREAENAYNGRTDVLGWIKGATGRKLGKASKALDDYYGQNQNTTTGKLAKSLNDFVKTNTQRTSNIIGSLKRNQKPFGENAGSKLLGDKSIGVLKEIGKGIDLVSEGISQINGTITKWVDNSAEALKGIYGFVTANLEGSGKTFDSIEDVLSKAIGEGGTLFKQQEYLSTIAKLSSQGIANNIEQRALLAQMASKTVSQFNITNNALLRLIRLRKQDMSAQIFGMESALKRALNAQFGDSSYLNELFDSVTSSLVDAVSTKKWSEATPFYGVLQSYLGSMHEAGVGSDFINAIARGINALGSGNVADLQSNETINRLFLLSMERIGMDYADVLQNGLSADKADALLNSVINYLKQISKNTNDNNVLKNSYSKLFNLSMADMRAIDGLKPVRLNMTDSKAIQEARNQLRKVNQRTLVSEQINNLMENAKFAFGENIATSKGRYLTFKTSSTILDFINKISGGGKVASGSMTLNGILKVAKAGAALGLAGSALLPAVNMIKSVAMGAKDVVTGNSSDITNLFDMTNPGGQSSWSSRYTSLSSTSSVYGGRSNSNYNNFKKLASKDPRYKESIDTSDKSWEEDDKDETLEILKELEQTIMENKEGRKALAVSVEAMSNDVLRSFASIFADEDSMENTFSGENEVLKKALFEYADDKTSSSNREKKADKAFATSPKGLSKANK